MKIEVVLIDSIDGDNLTSLKNYDKNKNLFEINKFEAKKNQMVFLANLDSSDEVSTLVVGTKGCETAYEFVNLGSLIGKKIGQDCDIQLISKSDNLDIFSIEFGIVISSYNFDNFKSEKNPKQNFKILDSSHTEEIQNKVIELKDSILKAKISKLNQGDFDSNTFNKIKKDFYKNKNLTDFL